MKFVWKRPILSKSYNVDLMWNVCEENSCKDSGQTKDVAQKDTCVKNKRGAGTNVFR